ncbi:MAG: methionine--tRNA ligase subunit beta [bacterium]
MISIEEFRKIKLEVGRVIEAQKVEGSEKLLQLKVNLGQDGERTLVAGIAMHYAPESLLGKLVVVVSNLEPATIRGIRSEGMLLAAEEDSPEHTISLLTLDHPVKEGSRIL